MIKLHLGCGNKDFGSDWIHIDGGDYPHLHSHDIVNLPFEKETVDLIYACHVFEYFDRDEAIDVLKEWRRVLKRGATLRLAVPDFEMIASMYFEYGYDLSKFVGPLYGKIKMGDQTIYHKTVYDFKSLKEMLENNGFVYIEWYNRWKTEHSEFDDFSAAYIPHMDFENGTCISLNVEAKKL